MRKQDKNVIGYKNENWEDNDKCRPGSEMGTKMKKMDEKYGN